MKKLLTILLFIIALTAAYSQSPFIYRNLPTVATLPDMTNNIQFIDIDNDGDKDLVDYYDQRIRFYKSNGVAIDSLNPVELLAPNNHFSFTDWDQDGYIDIILAQTNGIVLLKNLGDFNFSPSVTLFSGTFIANFSVSDINSDSYPDLIIYNGDIQLFINDNGSAVTENYSFAFPYLHIEPSATLVIYFEDVDDDGLKDMIFKSKQNKIYFYSQTGTYDYTLRDSIVSGDVGRLDHHPSIFLYDLNNDGKNEIITRNGGTFRVFNWSSGFSYTSVYSGNAAYAVGGGSSISTTIPLSDFYDVDQDGFLDIVAGNYVFFNNGNFTFNRVNINNPAVFYDPNYKCADINGNGKTDICYVYTVGDLVSNTNDYEAFFRSENVTGRTIEQKQVVWHLWGYTHYDGDVVDFDNDGDMDVFGFNRGKSILWENINDTLYPKILKGTLPKGTEYVDFVDINHDGYEDVLYKSSNQHLYRLNQSGNSLGGANLITNSNMVLKLIDDIDDDGINELFYHLSNSTSHTVYMYKLDTGAPVFTTSFSWNQYDHNDAVIRIGDYDLDGFKDIVIQIANTSMSGGDRLCIAKNDGQNNFSVVQNIRSNSASLIGVLDVDGDSYPDIICHNRSNTIYQFKNNQGTISSSTSNVGFGTGGFSSSGKGMLIDFDDDGLDDIVIQSRHGNQSLFRNNGHGFTLISTIPNSSNLVRIKDIDGDGDEDIICTNAWYENISNAAFEMEGIVFYDTDEDGIYNSSVDIAFPYFPVQLNSGWGTFYTDANGYFETPLSSVAGNYSFAIDPSVSSQFNATTLPYPSIISVDSLNPQGNLELGVSNLTNSIDGKLDITLSGNRCNESGRIVINYQNYSPETIDAKIKLVLAENSSFISSNQIPVQTTDTIVWQLNNLTPFKHGRLYANIQMPPTSSMGDTMHFQAQLILNGTLGADTITENIQQILRCAYDPNDKNITMNDNVYFGDSTFLYSDSLEYTIRFQNTGNDTAVDVLIIDNLSDKFDWNSVRPISASHSYNFSVDSLGRINVMFKNIHLPDSTTDLLGSMGYIKFKLNYREDAPHYVLVSNYARIYFDQNPPIYTEPVSFYRINCNDFVKINTSVTALCEYNKLQVSNTHPNFFKFSRLWSIDNQTSTVSPALFSGLTPGEHMLNLKLTNNACQIDTNTIITVHPKPDIVLSVPPITMVCMNDTLSVTANYNVNWFVYGGNYTWHNIGTGTELVRTYNTTTNMRAIYSENNCLDTIDFNIYIKHISGQIHNSVGTYSVCPNDSKNIQSNYDSLIWNVSYTNNPALNYIDTSKILNLSINNSNVILQASTVLNGCTYKSTSYFNLLEELQIENLKVRIDQQSGFYSAIQGPLVLNDTTYICTTKPYSLRSPTKTNWYKDGVLLSSNLNFTPTQSGTYEIGCDRIPFTIILNQSREYFDTVYLCLGENYTYSDGTTITNIQTNQTHVITKQEFFLCNTIKTTNLIVEQPIHEETIFLCTGSSYTYPDGTISSNILSSESHVSNLSSINGCDSIVTTHIQIANETTTTGTINSNSIELSVNNNAIIQWLDCNNNYEPIIGATGNVFTPTENGSYAAQIQLAGCTDTTECFILNTLTINSPDEQNMISYYPNPVKENLYINLHQAEENSEVFVRDVNGRLIAHEKFSNLKKLAIPFANLSNGIYIVTVKTSEYEKQIHVRKEL